MSKDAFESSSTNLEKTVQNGGRASSSGSREERQSGVTTPEMDSTLKEIYDIGVVTTDGPGPGGVLAKVLSRTISRISIDPGPPPDGGLGAWTQAGMAHLIVFNTWGYINSFGVFQTYYVATLGHSPSDISWVRKLGNASFRLLD